MKNLEDQPVTIEERVDQLATGEINADQFMTLLDEDIRTNTTKEHSLEVRALESLQRAFAGYVKIGRL